MALLFVISLGFSSNPSHSAPLDIYMLCVVTTHTEPEIWYIILASVYMVSHGYVVGLYLIPDWSIFVSHIVIKLHVCHLAWPFEMRQGFRMYVDIAWIAI